MSNPSASTRKRKVDVENPDESLPTKRVLTDNPSSKRDSSPSPSTRKSSTTSTVSADAKATEPVLATHSRHASPPWFPSLSSADYNEDLRRRLTALLHFSHPPSNRFTVHVVPSALSWPTRRDATHLMHGDHPLTVLLIGEIAHHFLHKDGKPIKYVSANLKLTKDDNHQAAIKLLKDHANFTPSSKAPKEHEDDTIRLSWATSHKDRHGLVELYLFNNVYDARAGYGPKSKMLHYAVDRVGTNDLIIAECNIQHYHVDDTGAIDYSTQQWTQWKTGYNLLSFAVLNVGEEGELEPKDALPDDDMPLV